MSFTDWGSHIQIDIEWGNRTLERQFRDISGKLSVRVYTVKPANTTVAMDALCNELHQMLPHFVYGKLDIERMGPMTAGLTAHQYFGLKDPSTDGKYGELLLFGLVEGELKCKLVSHKIQSLTNARDQVKGGDGLFIGNYQIGNASYPAFLIGESKVMAKYSTNVDEALESVQRFYSGNTLNNELIIAKQYLKTDINLDELYERLTPGSTAYAQQVLVHPILVMYNLKTINSCADTARTPDELVNLIKQKIDRKKNGIINGIKKKVAAYDGIKQVYVDFFILPCWEVDVFRHKMYEKIHGVPYQNS